MENLTLDFNNFGSRAALGTYEKCDSLTLTIVLDEKDYAGYKFKIVAKKSDGHIIEQDIKEQDINREEKIIKTELNNQFTTKEGVVKLEINMIKDGKEDTTKEAFFMVRDTINGEVVESTSIIPTLEGVKVFIDEAVSSLGDLEQAGEEIALINGEFKEAEIKRKSSELLRERSEKERVRLESIRTTEEADRIKAEAERKEAENNRKVAESNRKLNENTRKTNEAARVEAELNRQSLFEENEEIRNENEKLRIEAEKERKLTFSNNNRYESERVEAEKLRCIAEDKRVTAEKARANAEEERIKAETRRENTYTDFNDSEVERKNNEANRVRAETERVNAESGRNELFNTNEEKRNSTFIESERTRERAFNEAQSNRNEAYEESDRVREEAFKVSEVARNEAEEGRVAAELLRVEAEKLRVAGEENRNNTFTQSEEERQGVFEEAENARKVAESKRVAAETGRVEAEKLRVKAETGRVEAENLRVTAEEERAAAETKREEGFNKFEGKINANTEELKLARSATTGEEFNSLDERIDHEVDRLNKKIDVTMLQQENKGSHVVENTVEGMSIDMVIKGRTLQNILSYENENDFIAPVGGTIRDSIITINADGTNKFILFKREKALVKPSTEYTLILDVLENSINVEGRINIDGANGCFTSSNGTIEIKSQKILMTSVNNVDEKKYSIDSVLKSNATSGVLKYRIAILEGNWINKEVPATYFKGIKSFGEQEGNKISILSTGKNILPLPNENLSGTQGQTKHHYLTDGSYVIDGVANIGGGRNVFSANAPRLYIKEGEKLTFSYSLSNPHESIDGIFLNNLDNSPNVTITHNPQTLTVSKTGYVYLGVNNKINTTYNNQIIKIQIERGNISSSFETPKANKKDILLQNLGFDEGLRGFDLTICDELNDIKNVAIKRIEKHILNATEVWQKTSVGVGTDVETIRFQTVLNQAKDSNKFIANFPTLGVSTWDTDKENMQVSKGVFYVRIKKNKLETQDVNGFVKWLKSNPITVYYELAEPVEIPLSENINLKTFREKTYIGFENSISGTSSFKAPVNAAATISRLNRENRALEEENAKLKADTYKNAEDIIITNEELQITQSAVDHLLFSNLNASGTAMLYNGKKKGGGSMGAYLAMRIIKGKLKYEAVMKQYGEFKEDIDLILEAEGYGHLITQQ